MGDVCVSPPSVASSDGTAIRDADLLARLEAVRGTSGYAFQVIACAEEQRQRDSDRAARAALDQQPRDQRRRAVIAETLDEAPSLDSLRHIHSVLAICGLPYRRLPIEQREYERRQGRMALVVEAGKLRSPDTHERVPQPVPFGPKARLLMIHLCSQAVKQRSPTIEIADNLTGFMREMGFPATGGKRGTLNAFKEQLNALAAARMSIAVWDGRRTSERFIQPFSAIDVWLPTDPSSRMLWPTTLTFSKDFYDSLTRHALPLNVEAVRAFAGSARKLDLYFWLGYRTTSLDKPKVIPWSALRDQFGDGYATLRNFRRDFDTDLAAITEVFKTLPVKLTEEGLALRPAGPEVMRLPVASTTSRK